MSRTLLFLSAESFQAFVWKGASIAVARNFSNDSDGREQFAAFLERYRYPAYMLVDIIEEDFHLETVPHLVGSSRTALLERKFEQYYRSTPFHQATLLKRQEEGRRDDEFLFSALTNPQRISPWLEALLAMKVPLVGIFSVPNISVPLLKEITAEHVLLLTWERGAGLRQTYFKNKQLHFSRLTPINQGSTFSESVASETPRTQQYLKSLSLPPPGETLEVHLICHANDVADLQTKLAGDSDLAFNYIDIQEFAKRQKCKHEFADSDATPLLLNLLATKTPSSHYANSDHTHYHLLWRLRRLFTGLAILTLLAGSLWSMLSFTQGNQFVGETEHTKAQIEQIQQQTRQVQSNFGDTSVPAVDMKTAVLLARSLSQYSHPPKEVLFELSAVMDSFPRITLRSLSWQTSPADAAPSPYPAQVILFDGELTDFGNDHRKSLDYLDRFQKALTQHGYTVSVDTMPLDISSKGSISGDASVNDGKHAQFKLKIIWRHPS
ncbi:MAG: hypothetical protein WCT35_06130 [Sideroxydans sp.]|jgi:hypothetical protein